MDSEDTPGRIRTCDPRLRRPLLYPLSYGRAIVILTTYVTVRGPASAIVPAFVPMAA